MDDDVVDIQVVRQRMVNLTLVYLAIITPIAVIISLMRVFESGWKNLYFIHITHALIVIALAVFRNKLPYRAAACIVLGLMMFIGITGLFVFGLVGGGIIILFMTTVLVTVLFDKTAGLISCGVCLLVMVCVGSAVHLGFLSYSFDIQKYSTSFTAWFAVEIVILLVFPIGIILVGVIQENLQNSLAELRSNLSQHRRLVNNLHNAFVYRVGADGVFSYMSSSVTQVLGFSVDECLTHYTNYLTDHPANKDAVKHTEDALKGIKQASYELQVYHKDGSVRWLEASQVPVCDRSGNVEVLEGVAYDITLRKQAAMALKDSEEKYRLLFESANDAILLIQDDRFIDCNDKTFELFDCFRWQIIGQAPYVFSPQKQPDGLDSKKKLQSKIKDSVQGKMKLFEWRYVKSDGTPFDAEISLNRLVLADKVYVQAVVRNITDRKNAEEELHLRRAELLHISRLSTIGEMSSSLAHELNQPLCAATNYMNACLRRIKAGNPDMEKVVQDLNIAVRQADYAGRVSKSIKRFSRRQNTQLKQIDIDNVIRGVPDLIAVEIRKNSIKLDIQLQGDLPLVNVDQIQIEQILINLLINSIDAVKDRKPEEKIITIESGMISNDIIVSVSDMGDGFEQGAEDKIFESFFTTKENGLGIGLSICRTIIDTYNGRIWAESNAHGGATIKFSLHPN